MESDIIDKLLILLLILILPVSIFATSNYQKKIEISQQEKINKEQQTKIELAVNEAKAEQKSALKKIEIDQIYYATESSKLVITGKAPKGESNIMVSAVLMSPDKEEEKSASNSASKKPPANVLGQAVDVVAIKSDEKGEFTFVKKIDPKDIEIAEIRIDQDQSSITIKYDIKKRRKL